jgi:uncharacterized membrane protein
MTNGQATMSVEPNIGGTLCYVPCCIGFLFSIAVVVMEKKSRFMRFHALQSLAAHAAVLAVALLLAVIQVLLGMIAAPLALLISIVQLLVGLAFLGLLIFLMMKAHANVEFKLPTLGDLVQQWI